VRIRLTAAAALVLLLGACGTEQNAGSGNTEPPTTPPSTVETTPNLATPQTTAAQPETSAPAQERKCTASMLSGTIEPGDPGAGNRYATLIITNTAAEPCTLWGYGGLELVDATGKALPTNVTRQGDPAPALVDLGPGEMAAKDLHWTVVPTGNEPVDGPCQPEAAGARVIPPDGTEPFEVTYAFGSVCGGGQIDGSAYYKK
jgi:hypothetical protein